MKMEIVFKNGVKWTIDSVESFKVTEEHHENGKHHSFEMAQTPTEGKLFKVNPFGIDRSLFEKPMKDKKQEQGRQLIWEAFSEIDKHPEQYATSFYTFIPQGPMPQRYHWHGKDYATDLGGDVADWVQQALEWAQRISNGESWEIIFNKNDKSNWFRLIIWKDNYHKLVGGSRKRISNETTKTYWPAGALHNGYNFCNKVDYAVPLVVFK